MKKGKKDTLRQFMTLDEEDSLLDNCDVEDEQLDCCGMQEIYSLGNENLGGQIVLLRHIFEDRNVSQIILTDNLNADDGANNWVETKTAAYKGPITVNPKSKNKIQLYIVTEDVLSELEALYIEKKKYEQQFKSQTKLTPRAIVKTTTKPTTTRKK